MNKHTYEVEITYIDAYQNRTIKELRHYGLWSYQEAQRKEHPSTMTWEVSGDNPLTHKQALEARIKFTKQFVAKGERIKSIKFRELGAVL